MSELAARARPQVVLDPLLGLPFEASVRYEAFAVFARVRDVAEAEALLARLAAMPLGEKQARRRARHEEDEWSKLATRRAAAVHKSIEAESARLETLLKALADKKAAALGPRSKSLPKIGAGRGGAATFVTDGY